MLFFTKIHARLDNNVSKAITNVIRANVTEGCPKYIKDAFSSKSLCRGTITQLSLHPGVGVFEACSRSGYATETNLDSYLDKMNPARGIPAANEFIGKANINEKIIVPSLSPIGSD